MDSSATHVHDIDAFRHMVGDVPLIDDPRVVRLRSRDYFWYSPVLNAQLHGLSAEIIAVPRDEADVVAVARACATLRTPLTPRGGGTGNYGQAVPLQGGVLIDMTRLDAIEWHKPGIMRVGAGAKMIDIDTIVRPEGWELRMHPSTKRTATIGGFVAGGSGGVGSVTYGGLREPGNVLAARIVTIEEEPRALDLRGKEAQAVNHAYGTTGLITALEMPLAPAFPWIDVIVAFEDFFDAVAFGRDLTLCDGIVKKLVTPIQWPLPSYFDALKEACPEGRHILIAMIAEPWLQSFRELLGARGAITYAQPMDESPGSVPLYEYCWNHTTLQVLKRDRGVTYLQCLFPSDRLIDSLREMSAMFGDEVLYHCEFQHFGGRVTCSALPVVRYTDAPRLNEIIGLHEAHGVFIANPHVYTLEDGTRHKKADSDQLSFKHHADPHGLLNPGKMREFVARG